MDAYAVIETGGKQLRINAGDVVTVERLATEAGKTIKIDQVLAVSDGKTLNIGNPTVSGATVSAEVVEHIRGEKLISFKKNRRKGYKRKMGHRQELTVLKIDSVAAKAKKTTKKAADKAKAGE